MAGEDADRWGQCLHLAGLLARGRPCVGVAALSAVGSILDRHGFGRPVDVSPGDDRTTSPERIGPRSAA